MIGVIIAPLLFGVSCFTVTAIVIHSSDLRGDKWYEYKIEKKALKKNKCKCKCSCVNYHHE